MLELIQVELSGNRERGTVAVTPKQSRFIEEYLLDLNATQAAIRAGYSAGSASSIGEENLKKPEIAVAVAEKMEERSRKTAIDAAWVLREAQAVYLEARQSGRLPIALKALEIVGKHIDVLAFREQIDHRLTMNVDEARQIVTDLLPRFLHVLPDGRKRDAQ